MRLFLLLFLFSCQFKRNFSDEECEGLSLKAYRGFPKALHDFNTHCRDRKITYTKEHCQRALADLIVNGRADYLVEKYGKRVLECFSEQEKERFLRSTPESPAKE